MSFRLKTILSIAFIESILLIILIISGINFINNSVEEQLQQRAETTAVLFSKAVKDSVLSTDLATLDSFTKDVLTLPGVLYVRISNQDFVLAEAGEETILNQPHSADHNLSDVTDSIYDMVIDINEAGISYGTIELGFSTQLIEQGISKAQHWAISIAVAEVFLVALFSFILGTYLTRQLLKLKTASEQIALSGPGLQIKIPGHDEIAEVAHSFNSMSATLAESYEKLSKSIEIEKQLRLEAKQNQAQNDAILTASLDAIITIDKEGVVIDYNKMAEQTFGWGYQEVFGKKLTDFMIRKHKCQAHDEGMKAFMLHKESPVLNQRLELTALHKSGHSFPIEINIAPIETEQGINFTAFIRDISYRIEAETELRLAAQTFESAEAMFISNARGKIIRINKAFTRITGYSEIDVIGQDPRILSSGRHPKEYYRTMWYSLQKSGQWSGEIYNKRKNGQIYPEYLSISSVKDKNGKLTHYIAHFMDISQQKYIEESLRQARIEAEASNESKSRFLASMSHEIRTPMNAVLGILELLKDTQLSEDQLNLISTAKDSGELLLTIINDILDFTKMDIDEQVLQCADFDLHQLLTNSIELLKHFANKKSLALSLHISPDLPKFVKGDADRIQQILINLINNAIKFTEQGQVEVFASSHHSNSENIYLRFQVKDTGIGIKDADQDYLFEEFTMADQSHSRKYEGTGLGLAICRRLVSLMNGTIKLESEFGKGSTFEFTLQLEPSSEPGAELMISQEQDLKPSANSKVLLAEDNLANQMVIRSILEIANLQVEVVSNGKQAVEAVKSNDYDIVLMDISMPEMDGMMATKAIRQLPDDKANIPIVALTAHTLAGDKKRFLDAGMNDYLSKPIDRKTTLHCIARWTQKQTVAFTEQNKTVDPETTTKQPQTALTFDQNYVDEQVLIQLVKDTNAEIVPELLTLYIKDSQQRLAKMQTAITKQDFSSLEFEAHTIGSSAVAHGNAKLHAIARKIEHLCQNGEFQQAQNLTQTLPDIAERSFQQLSERAKKGFHQQ